MWWERKIRSFADIEIGLGNGNWQKKKEKKQQFGGNAGEEREGCSADYGLGETKQSLVYRSSVLEQPAQTFPPHQRAKGKQ